MNTTQRPEPTVGMPATINLFTDRIAAVVVKVNAKSIVVCRVETGEQRRINDVREPYPVLACDGKVDEPITGATERYKRIDTSEGPRFSNGSTSVTLGRSISLTDYRY